MVGAISLVGCVQPNGFQSQTSPLTSSNMKASIFEMYLNLPSTPVPTTVGGMTPTGLGSLVMIQPFALICVGALSVQTVPPPLKSTKTDRTGSKSMPKLGFIENEPDESIKDVMMTLGLSGPGEFRSQYQKKAELSGPVRRKTRRTGSSAPAPCVEFPDCNTPTRLHTSLL